MTEQRRVYLQPTGSVTLNKCILHFLETYNLGLADNARNAVKVLAITTMIPDVIKKADEMDEELTKQLSLLDSRQNYAKSDSYTIQLTKRQLVLDTVLAMYKMVSEGMAKAGITQKNLSDVASNISIEAFK